MANSPLPQFFACSAKLSRPALNFTMSAFLIKRAGFILNTFFKKETIILLLAIGLAGTPLSAEIKKTEATGYRKFDSKNPQSARETAISNAQRQILAQEMARQIPKNTLDYFGDELIKAVVSKSSSVFISVSVLNESVKNDVLAVSVECVIELEALANIIEALGIPQISSDPIAVMLAESGRPRLSIAKHLQALGFKVVRSFPTTQEFIDAEEAQKLISQDTKAKALFLVDWLNSSETDPPSIRGFFKGVDKPYANLRFSLAENDSENESLMRMNLLSLVNRNTLQIGKYNQLSRDKAFITIKGLKNPEDKITFTHFVFNNISKLFPSFSPDSSSEGELTFFIGVQNINSWVSEINSVARTFSLIPSARSESSLELFYRSRINRQAKEPLQQSAESGDRYLTENEANESFYEYNLLTEGKSIYGTLSNPQDVDIFKVTAGGSFQIELDKISDPKQFTVRLKFYDDSYNLLKSVLVPQDASKIFTYDGLIQYQSIGKDLFIKIENALSGTGFNIGTPRKIQYRLKVSG